MAAFLGTIKGAYRNRAAFWCVVNWNLCIELIKINILGSDIDIAVVAFCNNLRFTSVKAHPHKSRGCTVYLLIIDIGISHIEEIHTICCQNLHALIIKGISAELIIISNIHIVNITVFINREPEISFIDD